MEIKSYEHGVPCWVELGTPDLARATAFYSALFSWDVRQGRGGPTGFSVCHLRDRPVAGLGPQQNPGPPAWLTYISVDDADTAAASAAQHGGQVLTTPLDVRDAGRMAILADPGGAVFGIWQPGTGQGAGLVNEPGAVRWNELVTSDVAGALRFYPAVFGWKAESHGQAASGSYTEWKVNDRPIAGMMAKPDTLPAEQPPSWSVYLGVSDTDTSATRVTRLGGEITVPPTDIQPGRFAVAADPMGAVFSIITVE